MTTSNRKFVYIFFIYVRNNIELRLRRIMKTVQEAVGNGVEQNMSLLFLLNPSSYGKENAKACKNLFFSHLSYHMPAFMIFFHRLKNS